MRRAAAILAFIACVLSGAGVSRAVHMIVAHGGGSCALEHASSPASACSHGGHAHQRPDAAPRHAPIDDLDDCAVCDELSLAGGCPDLGTPFTDVIALLETVHDREASLLPPPCAPEACAARPPPSRA